ncbi:MAG: hypothetical protein ACOC34_05205 [Thermotogota bacterium]
MELLKAVSENYQRTERKKYIELFNKIKSKANKKYGLVQRGTSFGLYYGIYTPIGIVFGIIYDNLALGLGLGLLAASVISLLVEKSAEKKGLIY